MSSNVAQNDLSGLNMSNSSVPYKVIISSPIKFKRYLF